MYVYIYMYMRIFLSLFFALFLSHTLSHIHTHPHTLTHSLTLSHTLTHTLSPSQVALYSQNVESDVAAVAHLFDKVRLLLEPSLLLSSLELSDTIVYAP